MDSAWKGDILGKPSYHEIKFHGLDVNCKHSKLILIVKTSRTHFLKKVQELSGIVYQPIRKS